LQGNLFGQTLAMQLSDNILCFWLVFVRSIFMV